MRAVIQRVKKAAVYVGQEAVSAIDAGLLVLIGVGQNDDDDDINYMADKIVNLRIFADENGKMNRSVLEIGGEILIVSQFTLWGDARKGRRPNFMYAANPEKAKKILELLVSRIRKENITVKEGIFGAMMDVELINEGPVTILLDSERKW